MEVLTMKRKIGIILVCVGVIGMLLVSSVKGSYVWLWGFVPFIVLILLTTWQPTQQLSPVFGIGGGITTLAYFYILWAWIKNHAAHEGKAKTGGQIQLIGYSFLYITALFLCIYIGTPRLAGLANVPVISGVSIVIAFSIGFALLSVGNRLIVQHKK